MGPVPVKRLAANTMLRDFPSLEPPEKYVPALQLLARNLRTFREAQGYTQEELAHIVGCHRTVVSHLERQKAAPALYMIDAFAVALNVQVADLFKQESR